MSDPEFWSRVDAVFADAVDVEGDAAVRAAFVDARCDGDPALRTEVRSLLDAHEQAGGFLSEAADARPGPAGTGIGTVVGAYRLAARIGEGGMGDVYRAERVDGLFGHAVALKVTRGSIADPAMASRFATERQILATLQHPHIVTLLDGGTLADGRAYLVMELVDGVPITRYCADRGLGLDERLVLFRQVCAAAHYAHRYAVVHRDLKPANVLVTPDGVVKVLDFGVAKLLAADATDGHTVPGLLPGPLTPNYASPEQLRGLPVTTASDVYALGVLLYELVTGGRPYETTGQPLDRVIDLVVRTEPPRPSSAAPSAGEPLPWDRRRLRGDLDAIVLKALAKEPEARYASAEHFADDVTRFAAGQPVSAHEPSTLYVFRKLVARHRVAAMVAALALVGIFGASGVAVWQRQVAERQRHLAEARFADVRGIANTMLFNVYEAVRPLPGSTPVRKTIVAEALKYLERLQRDSEADLLLRFELAGAYQRIASILGNPQVDNLGDQPGALAALLRAERLIAGQARHPDAPVETVDRYVGIERQLSTIYLSLDRHQDATAASTAARERAEQFHARHPGLPRAQEMLAHALFETALATRDWQSSIVVWKRALVLYEQLLALRPSGPSELRNVALVEKYLGARVDGLGGDPAPHYQHALALDERRLAADPGSRVVQFDMAIDLANVASVAERAGDWRRAVALRTRSVAMRRTLLQADPQNMLFVGLLQRALRGLGRAEMRLDGQLDTAFAHGQEALSMTRATLGRTADRSARLDLAEALEAVAAINARRGRREAACAGYREAVAAYALADPPPTSYAKDARRGADACASR